MQALRVPTYWRDRMNPDKYNRSISLLCPTCGCSDFSYDDGVNESIQVMTCASCEREFNKDELIQENSEKIDEHLSEIKEEVTKDVADELRKSLKKAFSGSKNIRLK
jgi:uncharacterized Zn finger protein (UPF0148 family)